MSLPENSALTRVHDASMGRMNDLLIKLGHARENVKLLRAALQRASYALSSFSQYKVAADAMKAIDDAMQETAL